MKIKSILRLLAIAALLIYLIQPYFTWFAADDFCYMQRVQREGIIGRMWHEYMTWDGRSISLTYPVCRVGLYTGLHWVGPMIATVLLALISRFMLGISGLITPTFTTNAFRVMLLTATLWLACFNISSQTLYWTTGIGYNMDLFMLLGAYLWFVNYKPGTRWLLIGLPVFFYAGTCSPNGVLALLIMLGTHLLQDLALKKKREWTRYLFSMGLVIAAFLVVVMAPGNANRLTGMDKANLTHVWTIYFNVKRIFSNLWEFNTPVIWVLLAAGLAGAALSYRNRRSEESLNGWQSVAVALFEHRFLLAAFISFFFFAAFPGLHSPRTNLHFIVFAALYGLDQSRHLGLNKFGQSARVMQGMAAGILLIFIAVGGSQAFDARYARGQIRAREAKLASLKGKDVVLGAEDVIRPPMTRRFEDVSEDSTYWLNQCVSESYGLKSVKMINTGVKP